LFRLPAMAMAHEYDEYFQNHGEVQKIINTAIEKGSWIIFMYHNIGIKGTWGWYEWEEFIKDLELLKKLDYWYVNLDDAICYIQERNALRVHYTCVESSGNSLKYKFIWSDNLNNNIYNKPLTFRIELKNNRIVESIILDDNSPISVLSISGSTIYLEIYPNEKECLLNIFFKYN
ncbi:MAG: hypothetical protein Q8T08_06945, partial [Ignavibacteria bacterium]|nr:hypothetical protein [Ignavibacteria bacterium]